MFYPLTVCRLFSCLFVAIFIYIFIKKFEKKISFSEIPVRIIFAPTLIVAIPNLILCALHPLL